MLNECIISFFASFITLAFIRSPSKAPCAVFGYAWRLGPLELPQKILEGSKGNLFTSDQTTVCHETSYLTGYAANGRAHSREASLRRWPSLEVVRDILAIFACVLVPLEIPSCLPKGRVDNVQMENRKSHEDVDERNVPRGPLAPLRSALPSASLTPISKDQTSHCYFRPNFVFYIHHDLGPKSIELSSWPLHTARVVSDSTRTITTSKMSRLPTYQPFLQPPTHLHSVMFQR